MPLMHGKKIHYGWIIVAAAFIMLGATVGMLSNTFGLYIVPVCDEMGFTRTQMGMNQTIMSVGTMFMALVMSRILHKFRLINLMRVGAVMLCIAYFAFARATRLWMFYAAFAVISISMGLCTWVSFSIILNNWFHSHRGLAVGVAYTGSGVFGMVFTVFNGRWIEYYGWRTAMTINCGIMAALLLPIIFFIIKVSPYDMHLRPYGDDGSVIHEVKDHDYERSDGSFWRTPRFIWLIACMTLMSVTGLVGSSALNPFMRSIGFSSIVAANIMSLHMASVALGKALAGWMYDRVGTRWSTVIVIGTMAVGMIALMISRSMAFLIIAVVFSGFSCCFQSICTPILAKAMFDESHYVDIVGILQAASNLGLAIAPLLNGGVYDLTGSYMPAFAIYLIISAVMTITSLFMIPKEERN